MDNFVLFSGTANPELAASAAAAAGVRLGAAQVDRFPDGEVSVRLLESVRGQEVCIMQPTAPPVNDHLVELLAFADACRRSSAARVTAIVPYFGYSRSDKRHGRREPITASLVAALLQTAGVQHVLTLDLHTTQIEGFFHIPVDTLSAVPALCEALLDRVPPDAVVVSPDAGRVQLATRYAERLGLSLAVLHKRRESGATTRVTHLVGEVEGRACVLVDDMISTGGTLVESIQALREAGASDFLVAATHGLLLAGAEERLLAAGAREVLVTDTIAVAPRDDDRLRVVSIAPVLAAALHQIAAGGSLRGLV